MRWEKGGLIWGPDGGSAWAKSHAMVPTPVSLGGGETRIYTGVLDAHGVGRAGYVDVADDDPARVLRVAMDAPALDVGERGTFDDNGVLPSSVVEDGGKLYMYYNGFQLHTKIRYTIFTGLAVSEDGGRTFERVSRAAVLDRSDRETTFRAAPFVMKEQGVWRIWYPAGDSWVEIEGKEVPVVQIVYAESSDGVNWPKQGKLCVPLRGDEHGVGRPWIVKEGGVYRMFYSIRLRSRPGYSGLGYAESADGIEWTRMDGELGIDVSRGSWDGTMIRYGVVHPFGGREVMLYNGDNFGQAGFGYAVRADR